MHRWELSSKRKLRARPSSHSRPWSGHLGPALTGGASRLQHHSGGVVYILAKHLRPVTGLCSTSFRFVFVMSASGLLHIASRPQKSKFRLQASQISLFYPLQDLHAIREEWRDEKSVGSSTCAGPPASFRRFGVRARRCNCKRFASASAGSQIQGPIRPRGVGVGQGTAGEKRGKRF